MVKFPLVLFSSNLLFQETFTPREVLENARRRRGGGAKAFFNESSSYQVPVVVRQVFLLGPFQCRLLSFIRKYLKVKRYIFFFLKLRDFLLHDFL